MHVVERVLAVGCVRGRHLSDFASPRRVTAWGRLQSGAGGCARGAIKTRASETPRAPRSARRLQVPNPFPILTSSHEGWCGDSATKATAGFACTVPVCPTGSPAGLVVVSFFFLLHQLMLRSCCCCVRVVLDHRLGSVGTRGARPASRNWRANIQRPNTSTYGHAGARRPDLASFPREEPALLPTMCRSTISWWENFARPEAVQPEPATGYAAHRRVSCVAGRRAAGTFPDRRARRGIRRFASPIPLSHTHPGDPHPEARAFSPMRWCSFRWYRIFDSILLLVTFETGKVRPRCCLVRRKRRMNGKT